MVCNLNTVITHNNIYIITKANNTLLSLKFKTKQLLLNIFL